MKVLHEVTEDARDPDSEPTADAYARRFTETYHACVGLVFRALRRLGVAEAELDDATQEVFVVVYRRLDEHDPTRGSVRSWVYGVARGIAANRRRAAQRRMREPDAAAMPNPNVEPEHGVAAREATVLIERFLDTLPPERRVVFELCEIEGFNPTEVAELLAANRNTIYTRLRLAKEAFARWVAAIEPARGGC